MSNEIKVGAWSRYRQMFTTIDCRTSKEPRNEALAKVGKTTYHKPQSLVDFENEYNAHKYDSKQMIPPECRVRTRFTDKTANGLTSAIIAHLEYNGHFAARINTTGVYDTQRGQYRTTNARKGMADISAIINGQSVQLEIKAGRDKPRFSQLQVQNDVRKAGGIYEFIHDFSQYIDLYNRITIPKSP